MNNLLKQTIMNKYMRFEPVDDSTELGKLFNLAFEKLATTRIMYAPRTFFRAGLSEVKQLCEKNFYGLCLGEIYMHSVIDTLAQWKQTSEQYITEYDCRWKYYAADQRLKLIREWGGSEDDYNPDGSVKTSVGEEQLKEFSVVEDLIPEYNDVFTQTQLEDLVFLALHLFAEADTDINDFFQKETGKRLTTYHYQNGQMIANDWADELLHKASEKEAASVLIDALFGAFFAVIQLASEVRELNPADDNRDFFLNFPQRIQNIFELRIGKFPLSEILLKNIQS
jgi:hypothetical protein